MKKASGTRRDTSLSREQIVSAAIALLDEAGIQGLTYQALAKSLATGAGAIYWHIANKSELLTAACDHIVSHRLLSVSPDLPPKDMLRSLALELFDMIDAHPWIGSGLMQGAADMPMARIIDALGRQVSQLGVPHAMEWSATSALFSYILGVAGQNAANAQHARQHNLDRSTFLNDVASAWERLDPAAFAFVQRIARQLPAHDDRADFLAGVDLILSGLTATPA
ncbi:TetR/AcrR family transcriptional regulator [Rhizobium oryzicola]|uniref:TetR family transcriptional regulator n=1 Tax=Rhizobium oryzicola TaxID=1232668 RepID=A0ABT8STQ6_9HYPH|nr:TetR family transcriptional regulator [Rhizobium oryzicola]MDO1581803.1 TetR family transcriptional regulator [Rhizobium oryzicola]